MNSNVNIDNLRGNVLEQALKETLCELLRSIGWIQMGIEEQPKGWDFLMKAWVHPDQQVDLLIECKAEISPSQFRNMLALKDGAGLARATPVLGAPRISQRVAELCAAAGWGWFDLAGNVRLEAPGILYIERTGRAPIARRRTGKVGLGSPEAARVLRAILVQENAGRRWTHRKIRDHIKNLETPLDPPSLGLIHKVVRHLREEAFIQKREDGGFGLVDPIGLLGAFSRAYRFDRVRRIGLFTLQSAEQLESSLASLDLESGGFSAYAAFSAADRQAPMVGQSRVWVMVAARYRQRFMELTEAKEVDSGENLVALVPEDDGPFYCGDSIGRRPALRCTNALQTYLDLQHVGGRGEEAAEAVLNKCLKPAWAAAGLMD